MLPFVRCALQLIIGILPFWAAHWDVAEGIAMFHLVYV